MWSRRVQSPFSSSSPPSSLNESLCATPTPPPPHPRAGRGGAGQGRRDEALDVVVIDGLAAGVAVVDEDHHQTLEDAAPCLPTLRDLLADGLHADVGRQLAFTPRRIDGGCEGQREEEC